MNTPDAQVNKPAHHSSNKSAALVPQEVETLRAIHQVKLIEPKDEGVAIETLPGGVFGFTYSPQEQSPLFSIKMFQIFEVHKTIAGEVQIIGFISAEEAQKLADPHEEFVSIQLYPEPYERAVKAIGIPKSHILEHRGPTRENGNALRLKVEPFANSVQ